jgi:hypothetical protein
MECEAAGLAEIPSGPRLRARSLGNFKVLGRIASHPVSSLNVKGGVIWLLSKSTCTTTFGTTLNAFSNDF